MKSVVQLKQGPKTIVLVPLTTTLTHFFSYGGYQKGRDPISDLVSTQTPL